MRYYVNETVLRAAGLDEPTIRLVRALSKIDFAPEATADLPVTHKVPIEINGTVYYLLASDT